MTGRPIGARRRFRSIGWVSVIALGAAGSTFARPLEGEREAATPVTRITAEQLDKLPTNRDLLAILKYHNQLRANVGSPPLRWNPDLAAGAEAYGPSLSQGGTLQHASREGRRTIRENLSQSPRGSLSPLGMVQRWGNERRNFRPGKFPDVTIDGNINSVLHYSQMIWPTTTDVGCAHHADARFDWLICRYSPPGNKDGVAIGRGPPQLAQTQVRPLCTGPGGTTINCGNETEEQQQEEEQEGGVVVDGGGAEAKDDAKKEEVCVVDVNVHKPLSIDPEQNVIPDADEFKPGATTLRNDDSDWTLGAEPARSDLPVVSLPTDATRAPNPNENDLVKVIGHNPNALLRVHLFAFPTDVEASRALEARVEPVRDGRHANAQELAYFNAETKVPAAPGLPRPIPAGATTFFVEGQLGGQYRMVIGELADGVNPGDVKYDRKTNEAYAMIKEKREKAFKCEDQATVTAAVVDIYQKKESKRLTGFDVYWGGRPHFRAEVWPGGNRFSWGDQYTLGATAHQMPARAVDGEVASIDKDPDEEDAPNDSGAKKEGSKVKPNGTAGGSFTVKGQIEGGFLMQAPLAGNVPTVNRDRANRYPNRVSVGYVVNGAPLVRAEYLEVILPQVRQPAAARVTGSTTGVKSEIPYTIVDAFDRPIRAVDIADYLHLYGAGLKAWEALMLGADTANLEERGRKNDFLELVNVGVDAKGNPLNRIRFGTAQRSQASVLPDRMTHARFTDTLALDLIKADYDTNHQNYLWMAWTGIYQRDGNGNYDAQGTLRAKTQRRDEARNRNREIEQGRNIAAADARRTSARPVLAIPQDVILQLMVGTARHDVMVLQGNAITLFPPYFFAEPGFPGYNRRAPRSPLNNVFYYNIDFTPGRQISQTVGRDHQRPQR